MDEEAQMMEEPPMDGMMMSGEEGESMGEGKGEYDYQEPARSKYARVNVFFGIGTCFIIFWGSLFAVVMTQIRP